MSLGANVRRLRLAKGWTLAQLAERSGVEVPTLSALEVRDSRRSQWAAQIAAALGVTSDTLLMGGGSESPHQTPDGGINTLVGSMDTVAAPLLVVGDVMCGKFGPLFRMRLDEDALAPRHGRGVEILWSTERVARPGRVVLVRDRHGGVHAREFRQGRAPGHWIAAALHQAYSTLDSEADGLTLLAVLKGVMEPDD